MALAAVRWRDPHVPGSWGGCPVLAVTGRPCPFCGGMRAASDLTRGDLGSAWSSNAYGVVVVLVVLAGTAWAVLDALLARGQHRPAWVPSDRVVITVSVLVLAGWVAFGLLRLDPRWAWLQP